MPSNGSEQRQMKTCVVFPTYNEADNVGALVERVEAESPSDLQMLFVDDSSPDGTADRVREMATADARVHLLVRPEKRGIGSAYLDGFREALSTIKPDVLVEMDADLQHPPSKIGELVAAIEAGADVALASRYVSGGGTEKWSAARRAVSRGANWFSRVMLGLEVTDCTSGFRAYTASSAELLVHARLPTSGYSFQVAALFYLTRRGARLVEVPFTFETRRAGSSKLSAGEMARFFFSVVRMSLSRLD